MYFQQPDNSDLFKSHGLLSLEEGAFELSYNGGRKSAQVGDKPKGGGLKSVRAPGFQIVNK